jgi:hypothetical protein
MAPSATESPQVTTAIHPGKAAAAKPWVKSTGSLDHFEHIEVTPVIGREYPHLNLVSLLKSPNSEDLLRELALTSKSPHPTSISKSNTASLPTRSRLLPSPRQSHCRPPKGTHPTHRPRIREAFHLRLTYPSHSQFRARRLPRHRPRNQHHRL